MLVGHNTNVKIGEAILHVQTEDCGNAQALIDTTVYFQGRVLLRRTNNYLDLLPLDSKCEEVLRKRIDAQHHSVIEELRAGILQLALPSVSSYQATAPKNELENSNQHFAPGLSLELLNPKTWLTGKHAFLQVAVRDQAKKAVEGAKVTAKIEGATNPAEFSTKTGPFGQAQFEFEMPRLAGTEVALVIESSKGKARGQLRFQLRARPRVPAV